MFLLCTTKHYHIILIDDAICQVQLSQGVVHEALKSCGGVAEPKGQTIKLIKFQISHLEDGMLLGLWHYPDLPKSTLKVHC